MTTTPHPEDVSNANARARTHASLWRPLTMDDDHRAHPLDALYAGPGDALQTFLDAHPLTAVMRPRVEGVIDGRRVITVTPPSKTDLEGLGDAIGPGPGAGLRALQTFFMDRCGNHARGLTLKGPYGQTVLSLNAIGVFGRDVTPGAHANVFVGASETAEAALQPLHDSRPVTDWIDALEAPFSEAALNLNAGVMGTHFPHIVRRAHRVIEDAKAAGGVIDNLFVYGGWHNLIYNDHAPDDWRRACDALAGLAPRTCFFGLASPVLRLSWPEVVAFCERGHLFWGNCERTETNYESIRTKIIEYNAWLAGYCAEADDRLMIPVEERLEYDAMSVDLFYRDINHFAETSRVRGRLAEGINAFLEDNAGFFAPSLSDVSEYIYPVF